MLLHAINNTVGYLFNKEMGRGIGLAEPEPGTIITTLSKLSRDACSWLHGQFPGLDVHPGVQYGNESDLYFEDEGLLQAISSETRASNGAVWPVIHETSDKQPLKPGFLEKMVQLLGLCDRFGIKNITVHLPLETTDTTSRLVDALCDPAFLDAMVLHDVSVDLEQNWHGSWFGFSENVIALFHALDDSLDQRGYSPLKRKFGMTFDSGHHFAQYRIAGRDVRQGIEDVFDALGHRIRTLHLHGNDGTGDQHACFKERFSPSKSGVAFKENQDALLSSLHRLDFPRRVTGEPWNLVIVSEISVPFTTAEFLTHARLVFGHLWESRS